MTKSKCTICDDTKYRLVEYINATFKDSECFLGKEIRVCSKCGFGETYPKIHRDELKRFYEESYRKKGSSTHINFKKMHRKMDRSFAARPLAQLSLSLPYVHGLNRAINFLDIGAGSGSSFSAAQLVFDKVNLFAVEENSDAIKFYQERFKDITILKDIDDKQELMDVVLMSHSLEHFDATDLHSILEKLYLSVRKGGIVIVEIPNADLNDRSMFNRYEDTPHLSFFSVESVKRLAEQSKFQLVYLSTVGSLNADDSNRTLDRAKSRTRVVVKSLLKALKIYPIFRFALIRATEYRDFYLNHNTPFNYGEGRSCIRLVLRRNKG